MTPWHALSARAKALHGGIADLLATTQELRDDMVEAGDAQQTIAPALRLDRAAFHLAIALTKASAAHAFADGRAMAKEDAA